MCFNVLKVVKICNNENIALFFNPKLSKCKMSKNRVEVDGTVCRLGVGMKTSQLSQKLGNQYFLL